MRIHQFVIIEYMENIAMYFKKTSGYDIRNSHFKKTSGYDKELSENLMI